MDDEDDLRAAWTLHKPDGADLLCLGRLRAGMTRVEVAAVASAYGPVERVYDRAISSASMAAAIEDLAKFGVSAEDIAAAQATLDGVADEIAGHVTEDRGLHAPALDYAGGRLSRVATDHHCKQLTLMGRPVYEGDSRALLAALETMNRGEVLRQGDSVWFPRLGLTVIGFYGDREDGTVGLLDDPTIPGFVMSCWRRTRRSATPQSPCPSPSVLTTTQAVPGHRRSMPTAFDPKCLSAKL